MQSWLILTLGLMAIFLAILVLLTTIGTITRERAAIGRSLAVIRAIETGSEDVRHQLDRPFGERVTQPAVARLARLGQSVTAPDQTSRLRRRLDLAGNPSGWDVDRILAFKMLGLFSLPVITLVVVYALGGAFALGVGLAALTALLGYFLPNVVLYQVAYNRTERMGHELPDALDLLTISVEAGLGFDAALSQVARNTRGPLAEEFFRALQEMQIGTGRVHALRALGERTDLPELRGFVTAMVQADAFGIPIANVLRIQSREMRVKRSQHAEELAQKVPVKILFPLIFCILPTLFIVILGPRR